MRGEDISRWIGRFPENGSPPHARGRLTNVDFALFEEQDHPRMRGEDAFGSTIVIESSGSPPHARGRHSIEEYVEANRRITPACAGKTDTPAFNEFAYLDHPRMRGEDVDCRRQSQHDPGSPRMRGEDFGLGTPRASGPGSPPHARGRPAHAVCGPGPVRITPACAGKTNENPRETSP